MKNINSIRTKAYVHELVNMIRLTLPKTLYQTKVFPDTQKIVQVKPIPKTRHITHLKVLRPKRMLPVTSKIMEMIFESQFNLYLENNSI